MGEREGGIGAEHGTDGADEGEAEAESSADRFAIDPATLRARAELMVQSMGTRSDSDLSPEALIHELQVHQVELETQNHELRRAQDEIDRSRSRYFDLFDMAPIGYLLLDAEGAVREANFAVATLLGASKAALLGKPLSVWVAPESEAAYFAMKKNLRKSEAQDSELLLKRADGRTFWARFQATSLPDSRSGAMQRVALMDISSIKHAEEVARYAAENETLLQELQHRVKNTLNQILGFVRIQASMSSLPSTKEALEDLERRVGVLTNLYTILYATHFRAAVRLDKYLGEIAFSIVSAIGGQSGNIELKLDLSEVSVDAKDASSFGLIANELVTNALKHGYPDGRPGLVELRLKREGEMILLEAEDDGIELPDNFSLESGQGFGHLIILNLARQLGGEAFFESSPPKKRFGIRVRIKA